MCTVTLNINEALVRRVNPELTDMMSINRWAQQQMDNLIEDLIDEDNFAKEHLKPYTMEEINAMLDEAEANFAAGKGIPHEESMRRSRERLAHTEAEAKELTLRRGRDIKAGRAKLIPHEEVMQEMEQMLAGYEA